MGEHTPGPWENIGKDIVPNRYIVWTSNYNDPSDTHIIATGIESEANARLIAAAPDLLEALERLLPEAEGTMTWTLYREEFEAARAAIAKAREGGSDG